MRLRTLALVALGALVGHHFAYALAEGVEGGHGYLGVAAALVVPVGLLAAAVVALRALRQPDAPQVRARTLAMLQVGFFVAQELAETLATGGGPVDLAGHPALWIGVAVQPVVAWLLLRATRVTVALVLAVHGRRAAPAQPLRPPAIVASVHRVLIPRLPYVRHVRRRGPPLLVC